jgi:hypothetical protein
MGIGQGFRISVARLFGKALPNVTYPYFYRLSGLGGASFFCVVFLVLCLLCGLVACVIDKKADDEEEI